MPLPSAHAIADTPASLTGDWRSSLCGPRRYERRLSFEKQTFEATDIPHPCPGECVVQWVVSRKGTFVQRGSEVSLAVTAVDDPMKEVGDTTPLPAKFVIVEGALAERLPDGTVCRYAR